MSMVKYSQITQSNKSALSLQNFNIRKGVHFLDTDKVSSKSDKDIKVSASWHYRF